MKILLIVAMQSELQGFLDKLDYEVKLIQGIKTYYAKVNNVDLYIAKSDVGKVNSACLTTALCMNLMPNYVINAGIAGGLNPNLKVGDVVYSSKIAYHDFDLTAFGVLKGQFEDGRRFFEGSEKLLSLVDDKNALGLIVSGDQFVSTREKLDVIKKDFPKALACEMEGCSIAHAAFIQGREFLVIRAISDNVYKGQDLDNYSEVYTNGIEYGIACVVKATLALIAKL